MVYNKIYAQIGEERHITLDPINYQYDVKQILVIQGETVPDYFEADICNVGDTATLTMIGTAADGVEIPDKFLLDGRNVLVYVVIPGSGGDVQTRYDITIPVDERAEREDIDPSEEEQQQIDSLIAALNSGVGRAEAAAEAIQDMDVEAETLAAGSAASVEKTVDPETGAVTLNFGIPKGEKGNPGNPGADGTTPDFRIGTVTTLPPESPAEATITGTKEAPVLNLGIPQGEKGDPGGDSGTSDYTELENKPQINGHTLDGNKSASDLKLGTYSKPASGIPKTDLASDVQTSLDKADSALQTAPVTSVNSKTGAVTLDAGDVGYDGTETYQSGTAGAALSELNRQLNDVDEIVRPEFIEVTEALYYYPIRVPNGATLVIDSKTGESYSSWWGLLLYGEDKTNVLQHIEVGTSQTHIQIAITATGIVYARPNVNFSDAAIISVFLGDSLIEKVDDNTAKISTNTEAIVENAKEIADIKSGKNNLYDGISLILGRVYQGVYSDAITTIHCTDYLPITPGRTYAIYGGFFDQNYSSYYDKDKVYKGSLPLAGLKNTYPFADSYNFLLFTAPSDAAYTRINYFNTCLIDGTDIRSEWYFRDVTNLVWAKKKILVIGDSISTDVYGNYKKWVTDLQDEGFISNGLVNNNSQHATGFVATYAGYSTTTFINRLTAVGDLTGLDVVITFGGINDWIQSIDFDAFKTAVDTYFAYLIEHATQARIIVFSPLHTALYGTTNSAGKTQKDYDDYIKSVAKDYAFPCLNLTDESGFCPDKSSTFNDMWTLLPVGFSDHDGVHPIETWEKNFLAPMIKGFLSNL